MFKQIFIILVVIGLALTVTGCCCCGGSGYSNGYYSEVQDTDSCTCDQCDAGVNCANNDCQANCGN